MNKLWFNVKLALLRCAPIALSVACGYEAAYSGQAPEHGLTLHLAATYIAEGEVTQAVLVGARSELARAGADAQERGYPRLMLEVLRVDERPRGIAALPSESGLRPRARATSVGVVGRAWVVETPGAAPIRDTGDVRRVESYSAAFDSTQEVLYHDAATRAAAHELGVALVQRVLGEPAPTLELM